MGWVIPDCLSKARKDRLTACGRNEHLTEVENKLFLNDMQVEKVNKKQKQKKSAFEEVKAP